MTEQQGSGARRRSEAESGDPSKRLCTWPTNFSDWGELGSGLTVFVSGFEFTIQGWWARCAAVPRRARIEGSWSCVSLNSTLENTKEEVKKGHGSGIRRGDPTPLCSWHTSTRWRATLPSKVDLSQAVNCRASCGCEFGHVPRRIPWGRNLCAPSSGVLYRLGLTIYGSGIRRGHPTPLCPWHTSSGANPLLLLYSSQA